jgi:hypothetical protein
MLGEAELVGKTRETTGDRLVISGAVSGISCTPLIR